MTLPCNHHRPANTERAPMPDLYLEPSDEARRRRAYELELYLQKTVEAIARREAAMWPVAAVWCAVGFLLGYLTFAIFGGTP